MLTTQAASYFDLPEKLRTACWLMADRVRWLLGQRGAADEWRIEVTVGGAVAHAHVELGECGQGDEAQRKGAERQRREESWRSLWVGVRR